jgi:hypothetical protein
MVAPVDLDEVGPWRDRVVLAEADAAGVDGGGGEAGCCGDAGLVAVGADEVAGGESLAVGADDSVFVSGIDRADCVFPMEADSEAGGAINEKFMEHGAADAAAGVQTKAGFDKSFGIVKANAAQRVTLGVEKLLYVEAQGCEGFEGVGQEAFAAGLVDGRLHGIDDFNVKTLARGGDSGGETGGACSYYEDVRLR